MTDSKTNYNAATSLVNSNKEFFEKVYSILFNKLIQEGYCSIHDLVSINKSDLTKLDKNLEIYWDRDVSKDSIPDYFDNGTKEQFQLFIESNKEKMTLDLSKAILYALLLIIQKQGQSARREFIKVFVKTFHPNKSILEFGTGGIEKDYIFLNNYQFKKIDTIKVLIEILNQDKKVTYLYRGHSKINYRLVPSLFRDEKYIKNEDRLYDEIKIRNAEDFIKDNTPLEHLTRMQHYGLHTRMLDVTQNPLVALFFASNTNDKDDGEVIVMSAEKENIKYPKSDTALILSCLALLNHNTKKNLFYDTLKFVNEFNILKSLDPKAKKMMIKDFSINEYSQLLLHEIKLYAPAFRSIIDPRDLLKPLLIKPLRNNRRIIAQDALFICAGADYKHLKTAQKSNDYIDNFTIHSTYRQTSNKTNIYIIPSKNKKKLIDELNTVGINHSTLFPEIDETAKYLNNNIAKI